MSYDNIVTVIDILIEANVPREEIISLILKHYDIPCPEVNDIYRNEKNYTLPLRKLEEYLHGEGFSKKRITTYIEENNVESLLLNREITPTLDPKKLIKEIESVKRNRIREK